MSLVTMREILPYAEEKKIAIPAFNIDTMEITQAILETVEEENCPAIIATYPVGCGATGNDLKPLCCNGLLV